MNVFLISPTCEINLEGIKVCDSKDFVGHDLCVGCWGDSNFVYFKSVVFSAVGVRILSLVR